MDLACLVCVTLSIGAWFASAERHSVYWNSSNPQWVHLCSGDEMRGWCVGTGSASDCCVCGNVRFLCWARFGVNVLLYWNFTHVFSVRSSRSWHSSLSGTWSICYNRDSQRLLYHLMLCMCDSPFKTRPKGSGSKARRASAGRENRRLWAVDRFNTIFNRKSETQTFSNRRK